MKFRPCIDIHNGYVKQIVGGSLSESGNKSQATDNFVSKNTGDHYARLYKKEKLSGGHIILLNKPGDECYEKTREQALLALKEYPNNLQIGGGINDKNAQFWINSNASHVVITSFVFREGRIDMDRLKMVEEQVGATKIVLDLSVKKVGDRYHVATDRWQNISDEAIDDKLFMRLENHCDEYLVHAVDVEGKRAGIDEDLVRFLGSIESRVITYAGGIKDLQDIELIKEYGNNSLDFTVGSALDIFGGHIPFKEVAKFK